VKAAVAFVCLVGCSFAPTESQGTGDALDDAPPTDGPGDAQDPDAPLDGRPAAPGCELIASGLVACYQLDDTLTNGATTFIDKANDHDAPAVNFVATTRDVPADSPAMLVTETSSAKAAQSSDFSLTGNFTIVAWIKPINPDTIQNEGIVDHEGAWAMSIDGNRLKCWSNRTSGLFTVDMATFQNNVWQLVACEVNGNDGCINQIAADGVHTKKCGMATGNGTNGNGGVSIGSFQNAGGQAEERFNGALDDLRIYARALSDAELCTLAGHAACTNRDER
jgi:hypothetical protein